MKKCSRGGCANDAEFECLCNNERKIFCRKDNSRHMSEIKANHSNKPLDMKEQLKIQKTLIRTLESSLNTVSHNKKIIFEFTSNLILQLEECVNEKVKQLSYLEKTLQKAISDVRSSVDKMDSCNLKNAFKMTYKKFKAECEKWDLIKITVNTFDAVDSINKWIVVESQIDYLFTNQKIEPFKANIEEDKKIEEPPEELVEEVKNPALSPKIIPALFGNKGPLLNNSNKLICKNRHELKWLVTAPYHNFNKSDNIFITCQNCRDNFSTACWNCTICNYNVCEKCGDSVGINSQKLKCVKNHELFWRPDACFYYELKGNARGFRCTSCNSIKDEAHWHCRECLFDVCIACGKNKRQMPLTFTPKCLKNHKLLTQSTNSSAEIAMALSCCSCKSDINYGSYYACKDCLYFICNKCYDFMNYSIAGHPIIFCQSEHPPRWVKKSKFECDYCFKNLNQEHFNCCFCNYDICFECADMLFNYVIKGTKFTHGPSNHSLEWLKNTLERNNGNPIKCKKCEQGYLNAGMFYCTICDHNICLLCAYDPNGVKLNNKPLNNLLQNGQIFLRQFNILGN